MKDFHDLRTISLLFPFSGSGLFEAIRRTFERRQTPLPLEALPMALTLSFYQDETKQKQWNAFVAKNRLYLEPISLQAVMTGIGEFLLPVLSRKDPGSLHWERGGPWKST